MRCEVCGKALFEKISANIDGSRMLVCPECAGAHGSEITEFSSTQSVQQKQSFQPSARIGISEGLDLKQDFGSIVRKKRQQLNLTVEELAKKIFEKESILHKIENQKIVPSDPMVSKLEKALQISLREKLQD